MPKAARKWNIAKAKAQFSSVIELARSEGPQAITRRGRKTAVVVSAEEWERKARRVGNLAEFLAASPLRGSRVRIRRSRDKARRIDL